MTTIRRELNLSKDNMSNLRRYLKTPNHPLTVRLRDIGVSYQARGKGRGGWSYLVKA